MKNRLTIFKEKQRMDKQNEILKGCISRRSLVAAAGATLTGALVTGRLASQGQAAQQGKAPAGKASGSTTGGTTTGSGWCEDGLKNMSWGDKKGFRLQYENRGRSLPLSWIREIVLKVDGEEYAQKDMLVIYQNRACTFEELQHLADHNWREVPWWRLFDRVDIFVPRATPLSPGEHVIEGALIRDTYIATIYHKPEKPSSVPPQRLRLQTD
jgi:Domain of unknown function (DUF6379)